MVAYQMRCEVCGKAFVAARSHARTCSVTCRGKLRRLANAPVAEVTELPKRETKAASKPAEKGKPGPLSLLAVAERVTEELTKLGQLDTPEGVAAVVMARRLASPMDTASAVAAASRELTRLLDICRDRTSVPRADGLGSIEQGAAAKLSIVK